MSAASDLIDHLKSIADQAITNAGARAAGVSVASYTLPHDLYQTAATVKPGNISRTDIATLPALPALPALPSDMKVDYAGISALVTADVTKLQTSWMAKFLPSDTDVSSLNSLFTNILNGTAANAATASLAALAAETKATLAAITNTVITAVNSAITTMQANLATNIAAARTGVAAGLAIAGDGTQNIAWVNARDQVAREAARKEREIITKFASRGFSLPAGVLVKQTAQAQQDTLAAATQIATEQAVKTQQLFFDVSMKSVETYMRLMDAQNQSDLASFQAVATANLRTGELTLDASKFNAKLAFDNLGLQIDFTKFAATTAVQYRLGVLTAMNGLIHAYGTLVHNESDYIATIAAAQRNAQQALMDYYRAAIQYSEIGMKVDEANLSKNMEYVKVAASFIGEAVAHQITAATNAANIYSSTAATALSGLNGVASVNNQINS